MKLIYNILTIFIFLSALSAESQETKKTADSLYSVHYARLKELYTKSLFTKAAMHLHKLGDTFKRNLNFFGDSSILATKEGTIKWISENLETTEFESYGAAIKAFEEVEAAAAAEVAENSELNSFILYCAREHQEYTIFTDVKEDVDNSNPELLTLYKQYE